MTLDDITVIAPLSGAAPIRFEQEGNQSQPISMYERRQKERESKSRDGKGMRMQCRGV